MKNEQIFFGVCTLLAVSSVLACVRMMKAQTESNGQEETYRVPASVRAGEVIGTKPNFRGNSMASVTLVEFGDYECPPCKQMHHELEILLRSSFPNGRLIFRQFPLVRLHPYALEAAIAAEAAGEQGQFWQMHDLLYNGPTLSSTRIIKYVQQLGLDRARFNLSIKTTAKKRVENDLDLARRLQLPGTPMLILCEANRPARATSLKEMQLKFSL